MTLGRPCWLGRGCPISRDNNELWTYFLYVNQPIPSPYSQPLSLSNSHTPNQDFPALTHHRARYQKTKDYHYSLEPAIKSMAHSFFPWVSWNMLFSFLWQNIVLRNVDEILFFSLYVSLLFSPRFPRTSLFLWSLKILLECILPLAILNWCSMCSVNIQLESASSFSSLYLLFLMWHCLSLCFYYFTFYL